MHPRRPASLLAILVLVVIADGWERALGGAAPEPGRGSGEIQSLVPSTRSGAGFSSLSTSETGLAFTNVLPARRATLNQNLMNGSGVAAGDFDGDGRCDLYFCGLSGTNALYRNLGGWKFEEVARTAGVAGRGWASTGATFADLDGDGDLDLLVSTLGAGVQCFRNLGGGHFDLVTAEAGLTSTSGSTTLVLGDIDGDGDLDLYVVNYGAESVLRSGGRAEVRRVNGKWEFTGPQAHRLRFVDGQVEEVGEAGVLYLNDGAGKFQAVPWNSDRFLGLDGRPKPAPLDYGLGAQMRDVDGDGDPDLYICNDFQMPDRLWLNDGQGHFREAPSSVIRKFPFSSMGVDFGDLDRDGFLDFMVAEMAPREPSRALLHLSGMRPYPNLPGGFESRPQVLRNTLYRSGGDGTWSEVAEYAGLAATDWTWQPVFLDVDLDGFEDVLTINGMMFDTQDRDTLARIQALGRQSPEAARTNLLLYPPYASPNLAYRNLGSFSFRDVSAEWGFDSTRLSSGIALADLDNDGDADLAINCLNDAALLCRNNASAPRLAVQLRGRAPNTQGTGARIEVEGGPVSQQQEILAGGRYLSGDQARRTFACGTATQLTVRVTWRAGRITTVSNVAPNSLVIVEEREDTSVSRPSPVPPPEPWLRDATIQLGGHSHHEELFDDFARQPLLPKQLSTLGPSVAWCDLDGDHREELVVGTGRGGTLGVFRWDADGKISRLSTEWHPSDDVLGLTGWVTASGRPALLAAVADYEAPDAKADRLVEITLEAGGSRVAVAGAPMLPRPSVSLGAIAAADYDGDGDLDLFTGARVIPGAYPRAGASSLWRREAGRFEADTNAAVLLKDAGMVSGAVWSDLENDGFPELILACEWGPLRILRNQRGRLTAWDPAVSAMAPGKAVLPLSAWTGWWTAVTTGDFNGDGRLDLVAANWGLNTGYRASFDQPLRIYYGEMGSSLPTDLVESVFAPELAREVPRRSLNALGQAFPMLSAAFPTHRAYAEAGTAEILSAIPEKFTVATAATLESAVFLNLPTGWVAMPLPPVAQFAPAFGLVVSDLDADGHLDLFLAQGFYATRVEWPRNDAGRGLWLQGDGAGGFRPLRTTESGVLVPGEQRGAALGDPDRDGAPELVVGQNGTKTTLWRARSSRGGIAVEIEGPPSNPVGYGVTVQPRSGDHRGPIQEIHAAGGYGSVDAPVLHWASRERPQQLLVRWPGGREQLVPVPATGSRVVVR